MSEPIVQKQPVSNVNPFAKAANADLNAGAVAIESERAIAEAQGKLVIAKRFPRDQARAYTSAMDACKRPGLAEEACYSFPRGGQTVSGPSIRLAETLAACWGNLDYGIRELSRKDGVSEMEAYCWDLETNVMSSQKFTVRHIRDTRGGGVKLTEERDIYELTANMAGRRLRARVLAILPSDLVQAAVDECGRTLAAGGSNEGPIIDRVRKMAAAFQSFGVTVALIEKRLGHGLDTVLPEELADLRKIHNSIRDNISKPSDWFGDSTGSNPDLEAAPPVRPEPPKRHKRGAAAVVEAETVQAPTPEPVAPAPVAPPPAPEPAKEPAHEKAAALKEPDPVPEPAPVTPAPSGRAFLKEGEELTLECKILAAEGRWLTRDGVRNPGIYAKVSGGYNGEVWSLAGGIPDGEDVRLPELWKVGGSAMLTLRGELNKKEPGRTRAFVQKIEAVLEEF